MKSILGAALALAIFCAAPPSFANTDPSDQASALGACAALCSVATPVLLSGAAVYASVGASDGLVRIVDATGKGLSELTTATLDVAADAAFGCPPGGACATACKKQIPLVVRRDYLELNEKVQTDGK